MTKTIVLISCVSKKLSYKAKARDLYTSTLFRLNLNFAQTLSPSQIFVLSAEYGLVDLDEELEPYDLTLNSMPYKERKQWAERVIRQMRNCCDPQKDHFIFLAGQKYRQYIIPYMSSYEIPMEGLRIGEQLQFLKQKVKNE